MNRLAAALLAVALLGGCGRSDAEFRVLRPHFAALLDVPDLVGEVVIRRDGEEIARTNLVIDGESASARLPGLPAGADLEVEIVWRSGEVTVARTAEPKVLRLQKGRRTSVEFAPGDYAYPDDDGDGASNITEVVWAADNPSDAAGAVEDPDLSPPGFFSGVTATIATAGDPGNVHMTAATSWAVLTTSEAEFDQGGNVTFKDHMLNSVDLRTGQRLSFEFECPRSGFQWDVRRNPIANPEQTAVFCGNRILFYKYLPAAELEGETTLFYDGTRIEYGKDGNRLYAIHPDYGLIVVIDLDRSSPTFSEVLIQIDGSIMSGNILPLTVRDTGDHLLIGDAQNGGLVVLSHTDGTGYHFVDHVLMDELPEPLHIVLHPSGRRAYVAENNSGLLVVLDIEPEEPAAWSVVAEVEIAPMFTGLTIDYSYGNWVYALTTGTIARLDTLTNEVTWKREFGSADRGFFRDIALSPQGAFGVVSVGDCRGLMVLGKPDPENVEWEPNNDLADLDDTANVIGPPPARVCGWADIEDDGSLSFDYWAITDAGRVDYTDDIDDLWTLDPGDHHGRLAIGVFPTNGYSRMSLTIHDPSGDILDLASFPMGGVVLSHGTGVFLVTDPVDLLPPGTMVGAAIQDFDFGYIYTPYEIIALPVDDPLPAIDEVEPNNSADQAPLIGAFPVVVYGTAEASDQGEYVVWGNEDAEDCYKVRVDSSRIAVRLDQGPDSDLDIFILDSQGGRIARQYGMIGQGLPEFFAFEPRASQPDWVFLVCVVKLDDEDPPESDYTLTFVNFDM